MVLSYEQPKKAQIVYFSGTGGTQMAATALADAMAKCEITAELFSLNRNEDFSPEKGALLIVMYPVYACAAPEVIDEFVNALAFSTGQIAAVIAVSGGGEVSPNTASRCRTIRHLKKKGYETVYEDMIVMPPNMMIEISAELSILLLDILPEKTAEIATAFCNGVVKRMKAHVYDRFFALTAGLERIGGRNFGKKIKVSASCKSCGLCVAKCPRGNITMEDGLLVFHDRCVMCLGCIYRCPQKALTPGSLKSFVFESYDLKPLQKQLAKGTWQRPGDDEIKAMTKGYMLSGIRKYLLKDG